MLIYNSNILLKLYAYLQFEYCSLTIHLYTIRIFCLNYSLIYNSWARCPLWQPKKCWHTLSRIHQNHTDVLQLSYTDIFIHLYKYFPCLSVCLHPKRQNGWTDQAQILYGTLVTNQIVTYFFPTSPNHAYCYSFPWNMNVRRSYIYNCIISKLYIIRFLLYTLYLNILRKSEWTKHDPKKQ